MSKLKLVESKPLQDALEGQSDEIKARVYDLVMRWGIEPESEFFIIFVAMGQIVTLVEDAPERFQEIFNTLGEDLIKWGDSNLEVLEQVAKKVELMEKLATSTEGLTNSLAGLVKVCGELIDRLQTSDGQLNNYLSQLRTSEIQLNQIVQANNQKLQAIEKKLSNPNLSTKKISKNLLTLSFSGLLILSTLSLIFNIALWSKTQINEQRIIWLLQKANRTDCSLGIKALDSVECRSIKNNQ